MLLHASHPVTLHAIGFSIIVNHTCNFKPSTALLLIVLHVIYRMFLPGTMLPLHLEVHSVLHTNELRLILTLPVLMQYCQTS